MGVVKMMDIILIEIISIVSFLYSVLTMIFYFPPGNELGIIFIWTIGCSMIYALNYKKSKIYEFSILLLLLPLIRYHGKNEVLFILITTIVIYMYIKTSLHSGTHYGYVNRIKKSYLIYIPLVYLRFLLDDLNLYFPNAISYIIIYFLSSIMLSRTIRHLDSHMDIGNIRKNNVRQLLLISTVFLLATFEKFKDSIFDVGNKVLELIYYPLYLISSLVAKLFGKTETDISKNAEEIIEQIDVEALDVEDIESLGGVVKKQPLDFTVFKIILGVILIIMILYIIYRLIKKEGNRRYESTDYIEEREYIKQPKKKKKRFDREKYPKELKDQIRYYYRKFLNKLSKKDVEILKTDSSLSINKKAERALGKDSNRIREIYIRSRYSDSKVDEDLVEEIRDLYKKL